MPKSSPSGSRREARRLFEEEGLGMAAIARRLGLSRSTVKNWRYRDGWVKPEPVETAETVETVETTEAKTTPGSVASKTTPAASKKNAGGSSRKGVPHPHPVPEKSRANLKPPFEKGNKAGLKHGFYAKLLTGTESLEILEAMGEVTPAEVAEANAKILFANSIVAQREADLSDPGIYQAMMRAGTQLSGAVDKWDTIARRGMDGEAEEVSKAMESLKALNERARERADEDSGR